MIQRMTGGDAIVSGLKAHGVDQVFGLPGVQLYGLFDAFARAGMKVIGARHEQGSAYMAFGAARATGKPQVCAVVPGPGMLNASAAMLTAYGANAPVLMLTGQVSEAFLGRERGALHEMRDQLGVMRGFTKWAARIEHPSEAPAMIARAFQEMTSGRPGPVALEAPWDFFTQAAGVPEAFTLPPLPAPDPDPDAIAEAAALLNHAKAPMIFTGGGAQDAAQRGDRLRPGHRGRLEGQPTGPVAPSRGSGDRRRGHSAARSGSPGRRVRRRGRARSRRPRPSASSIPQHPGMSCSSMWPIPSETAGSMIRSPS